MTVPATQGPAPLRWRYRVATVAGAVRDGELEAPTEAAALAALRQDGVFVVELAAQGARGGWRPAGTGGGPTLAVATRSVATLLEAGVPLDRALDTVAGVAPGTRWCRAYGALARHVRAGGTVADGITRAEVFPAMFAPMLAAAEGTGALPATMARLADEVERTEALRQRLRSALAYPAVLAASTTAGILVVLLVVVPRLAALVADGGGTLPWGTRLLLGASSALTAWGGWGVLLLGAAAAWGWGQLRTPAGRTAWAGWWLRMPVVGGFLRRQAGARYLGTLAAALEAGVPLLSAMALARGVAAAGGLEPVLADAERAVQRGVPLAQGVAPALPPVAVQLLAAGESAGALAPMAQRAAQGLEAEAMAALESGVALLSPVLVAGFGAVVGGVALALLQAIYGLNPAGP